MLPLLRKRRSIRKFSKKGIDRKTIRLLTEALLRAPSSRDIKPCHFIFVNDRKVLEKLSHCKEHGSAFLAKAALGIVLCADETKSDVWVEDCSIASIIVQMAVLSCRLGSCWIQVRNRMASKRTTSEEHIRDVCSLPGHFRVESIIAIGHPAEKKRPVRLKRADFQKVYCNTFGSPCEPL